MEASCRVIRHSARESSEPIVVTSLGVMDYRQAWTRQRELATMRADGEIGDQLLIVEHPAVYTAGRRTEPADRPLPGDPRVAGIEVVDTDRGGRITWHGPGQLVGYPIIKLAEPLDVVDYVRRIEEALIATCATFGVSTGRIAGRSGAWVDADLGPSPAGGVPRPQRKVGALGIRVARGVTLHGFALNVDIDFTGFDAVNPCGITDAGVTSLAAELGTAPAMDEVTGVAVGHVRDALDGALPLSAHDLPSRSAKTAPTAFLLTTGADAGNTHSDAKVAPDVSNQNRATSV